jgi:hypothetical protein
MKHNHLLVLLERLQLLVIVITFLAGCQKSINEKPAIQGSGTADMAEISSLTNPGGKVATDWYNLQLRMLLNANPAVPPIVANRLFAYSGIALYEAARFTIINSASLHGKLYQMPKMPVPDNSKKYSWVIAANASLADITRDLFPSLTSENNASIDSLENVYNSCANSQVANRSKAFGEAIAAAIFEWSHSDLFDHASDPYTPPVFPGAWKPTPPFFTPPVFPYLGKCRPFLRPHSHGTTPPPLYTYSKEKGSDFYKMVKRDYNISQSRTNDQTAIALFWNDVGVGIGYTPMGHDISILNQALKKTNASLATAAKAYVKAGMAIWDASIVCWRSKYKYNLVRPVTYIRKFIDTSWLPLIGTPSHPEYPAAHAFITTAVMEAISSVLGRNYAFTDHTYDFRGFAPRRYHSFNDAALESGKSRFYGGIHYIPSIDIGHQYGLIIGKDVAAVQLTE